MPSDNAPGTNGLNVSTSGTQGAVYVPVHTVREVTIYPIEESEMDSLADLDKNVAFWQSIGAACAALVLGCAWDIVGTGTDKTSVQQWAFTAFWIGVSAFSFYTASSYRSRKTERLSKIRKQSRVVQISPLPSS